MPALNLGNDHCRAILKSDDIFNRIFSFDEVMGQFSRHATQNKPAQHGAICLADNSARRPAQKCTAANSLRGVAANTDRTLAENCAIARLERLPGILKRNVCGAPIGASSQKKAGEQSQ